MDLFLYDDDDLIELENNEQLQRYYCLNCGSRNIEPLSKHCFFLNIFNPSVYGDAILDIT